MIDDAQTRHTPSPGPLYWDWRCLVCGEPVANHPGWWARLKATVSQALRRART